MQIDLTKKELAQLFIMSANSLGDTYSVYEKLRDAIGLTLETTPDHWCSRTWGMTFQDEAIALKGEAIDELLRHVAQLNK